jgi:hypothetical protein
MTVQHADIFHCLACGRMSYEPHGTAAPICCDRPMTRAVADVVAELPESDRAESQARPEVEDHAFLAEAIEISSWCRSVEDVDAPTYEQLARRLQSLHGALIDQFDDEERSGLLAKSSVGFTAQDGLDQRLRKDHAALLESLDAFVHDLFRGESSFRGWSEVCERFDSFSNDFRRHEEREARLRKGVRNVL